MRVLQSVGLAEVLLPKLATAVGGVHFGADLAITRPFQRYETSERLGWASDYFFYQPRRQDIIAPNFTLVPELVVGTSRIATLPTLLADQMAERFPLRLLPCPLDIPPFIEKLQWNKYQERDPAFIWLRSLLRNTARDLSGARHRSSRRTA